MLMEPTAAAEGEGGGGERTAEALETLQQQTATLRVRLFWGLVVGGLVVASGLVGDAFFGGVGGRVRARARGG